MKRKLIISFIITFFLLLSIGAVSISKMIQLSDLTKELYNHPLSVTNSTKTIQSNIISMHRYMKDVVLAQNKTQIDYALSHVSKSEVIVYKEFASVFKKYLGSKKDIQTSYDAFVKWKPIRDEITKLAIAGKNISAANITKSRGARHVELLNEQVSKLIYFAQLKAEFFLDNSIKIKKEAILITSVMLFLILIIITSILFLLLKNLSTSQESMKKQNLMLLHQSRLAQMGEMISMIAHQWRQPLGSISATSIDLQINLQLQTYDLNTKDGQDGLINYFYDSLKTIDSLVNTLTTTINDFRDFYKSNKKLNITLIRSPIKKALDIIRKSLEANNISIVESYNTTKKVEVYFNEFMQVILNIIKNAQDNFNERNIKQAKIIITCTDTKNGIQILITDNGGGIAEDILPNVFDPYFSTKEKKNGTGLGLYMSKIIINKHHNGNLNVVSANGHTSFKILLNTKITI